MFYNVAKYCKENNIVVDLDNANDVFKTWYNRRYILLLLKYIRYCDNCIDMYYLKMPAKPINDHFKKRLLTRKNKIVTLRLSIHGKDKKLHHCDFVF